MFTVIMNWPHTLVCDTGHSLQGTVCTVVWCSYTVKVSHNLKWEIKIAAHLRVNLHAIILSEVHGLIARTFYVVKYHQCITSKPKHISGRHWSSHQGDWCHVKQRSAQTADLEECIPRHVKGNASIIYSGHEPQVRLILLYQEFFLVIPLQSSEEPSLAAAYIWLMNQASLHFHTMHN